MNRKLLNQMADYISEHTPYLEFKQAAADAVLETLGKNMGLTKRQQNNFLVRAGVRCGKIKEIV